MILFPPLLVGGGDGNIPPDNPMKETIMAVTRVYEVIGSNRRLLNTIDFSSRFRNMKLRDDEEMSDPKVQARVAQEICEGWHYRGNRPEATYAFIQSNF